VLDGVTGWLVTPGDSHALAGAMERAIDDPASARRMGEEGRRRAVERYDVVRYVRRIERVYDDVLRPRPQ
jgi:starch synthase